MKDFKDILQKYKNNLIDNGHEEDIKVEAMDTIEETNARITKDSKSYKESNKCIFRQDISYNNAEKLVSAVKRYEEYSEYSLKQYKDQVYQEILFCFESCENPIEMLVYSIRELADKMYINSIQDIIKDFINDYRIEIIKAYENILNNWIWQDCIEFVLNSIKLNFLNELQEQVYNLFVKNYSLRVLAGDTLIEIEAKEKFVSMVNFLVINTSDSKEDFGAMKNIIYRLGKNSEYGSRAIYKVYLNIKERRAIKNILILGIKNNFKNEIYSDIEKKLQNKQTERWVSNEILNLLNSTQRNPKSKELLEKCKCISHIDKRKLNDITIDGIDELKEIILDRSEDMITRKNAIIKLTKMQKEDDQEKIKIIETVSEENDVLKIVAASALTELGRIKELTILFKYLVASNTELSKEALNQIRRLKCIGNTNVNTALISVTSRFLENDETKNTERVLIILEIYSTVTAKENIEDIIDVFLKKLATTKHQKIKIKLLEFFSKNYSVVPNSEKDRIREEITKLTLDEEVNKNAMEALKNINKASSSLPESIV